VTDLLYFTDIDTISQVAGTNKHTQFDTDRRFDAHFHILARCFALCIGGSAELPTATKIGWKILNIMFRGKTTSPFRASDILETGNP